MQGFFHEVALDLVRADGSTLPVLVNAEERRDADGGLRFVRVMWALYFSRFNCCPTLLRSKT